MTQLLNRLKECTVVVIGDLMLDRYWWGGVERISPEAPVPVIELGGTTLAAGGAANVAANTAGLGAKAILLGIAGDDEEGRQLLDIVGGSGVDVSGVGLSTDRPTTVKTRVIAHNQQVVRVDRESRRGLTPAESSSIEAAAEAFAAVSDIAVFSDYAKGTFSKELTARLITIFNDSRVPVAVDPKGADFSKYEGAMLVTPNEKEALAAAVALGESDPGVEDAGFLLMRRHGFQRLLITRGEEGMLLFRASDERAESIKATARMVYDVTGAGDTVIAAVAASLASGIPFSIGARIANAAAGEVIRSVGTSAVRLEDLERALEQQGGVSP